MKNKLKIILICCLLLALIFVGFTVWDNFRIVVVQEEIIINDLPSEFANFKILQISDLHEREFGKNQKRLLNKIDSIDYDVLVFTGDMLDNSESTNYDPFYTILDHVQDNKKILVVPGNADGSSYNYEPKFEKSDFIIGMEERGATFVESMISIDRHDKKIHFVNFELAIIKNPDHIGKTDGSFQAPYPEHKQFKKYQQKLWKEMIESDVFDSSEITIALNHFPIPDARIDYIGRNPNTMWQDFDLIIAGHYHGGQIRLPLIGALFIPDPWYEPNSFFPPENRVMGLWEYNETKQYVSAGLGMSDAIPFLKFRLFNPPEVNVITLVSDKK